MDAPWLPDYLQRGTAPDTVGELVVEGIVDNHLYIYTDASAADGIALRTSALLAAMPDA